MAWGRLDDSLYDHQKLDDLPSDLPTLERIIESLEPAQLVRLAAIGLWTRTISWSNRFLTDGQAPRSRIVKLDGSPELADALVAAGMFEATAGGYHVHDFLHFNPSRADVLERRAEDAKRQAEWRARKKAEKDAKDAGKRHGVSHDVTPIEDDRDVTGGVTPLVTASHARDSRSANPGPARPGPDSPRSTKRGSSDARGRPGRADVIALRARLGRVSKAQRAVLDEILSRHDRTGPEFAAAAIRATPPDRDPLEAVMAADRMWQEAQRRRVDAEEQAWQAEKAGERNGARAGASSGPTKVGTVMADEDIDWLAEAKA